MNVAALFRVATKVASGLKPIAALMIAALLPAVSHSQAELFSQWMYDPVTAPLAVAYSPDGKFLALGGNSGVQIYTVANRQIVACIPTPGGQVLSLAFSPDSSTLAVGGWTTNYANYPVLELLNAGTGKIIRILPTAAETVAQVAFSPDGKTLAVGGRYNGTLEIWNVATGSLTASLPASLQGVYSVAFSPDGTTLAVSGYDENDVVQLWNVTKASLVHTLGGNMARVVSLSFSSDGKSLAGGGMVPDAAGLVEIWNVANGALRTSIDIDCYSLSSVAYSKNGKLLAVDQLLTQSSGNIELWNTATNSLVTTLETDFEPSPYAMAFTPDGNSLSAFTSKFDATSETAWTELDTWNLSSGIQTGPMQTDPYRIGMSLAFSPDGKTIALGGVQSFFETGGGRIEMWDSATGGSRKSLATTVVNGVVSVAITPDNSKLADCGMGASGPVLELQNLSTGQLFQSLPTSANKNLSSVAISPNGAVLADGGLSRNGGVLELWNPATGGPIAALPTTANGGINSVAFTPDGLELVSCGTGISSTGVIFGVVEVWDVSTGRFLDYVPTTLFAPSAVAFSRDGKTLAVGGQQFIQNPNSTACAVEMWDFSTGNLTSYLPVSPNPNPVVSICFSQDGSTVFAATSVGIQAFSATGNDLLANYLLGQEIAMAISSTGTQLARIDNNNYLTVSATPIFGSVEIAEISFNPTAISTGSAATATVTLTNAPAKGGSIVSLSSSNIAAVIPTEVSIAAGARTATFSVSAGPVNSKTLATITATSGNSSKAAKIAINPAEIASLQMVQPSIASGSTGGAGVTLKGLAGSDGALVTLSCNNPIASVPPTVTVQAGQTQAYFDIQAAVVNSPVVCKITATLGGQSVTATFTVTTASVSALILGYQVDGGTPVAGTVLLDGTASAGGLVVLLSSNNTAITVPASVTVPAGQQSASFTAKTAAVTSKENVTITAKGGGATITWDLEITPLYVETLIPNVDDLIGGASTTATLTLSGPAPAGGVFVQLSSSVSSAIVPASVLVAAGQTTATFTVQTLVVGAQTNATLAAQIGQYPATWVITIEPPPLTSVTLNPTTVQGGQTSLGTVTIASAAPAGGVVVSLWTSVSSAVVPPTVTIPAGKTSATFTVTTSRVTSSTPAQINVGLAGVSLDAILTIT